MFSRSGVTQFALCYKKWILIWVSYVMFAVNVSLFVMLFVFMNLWRFSHAGRVCSGDLLASPDDANPDIYLVTEGKFLKVIILLVYLVLFLATVTVCISACFLMKPAMETNELGESKRVTALTMPIDNDYH